MKLASLVAPRAAALRAAAPAAAADPAKVFRFAFPIAETGFDPVELSDLYSGNLIANIFDTPSGVRLRRAPDPPRAQHPRGEPEITEDGTL